MDRYLPELIVGSKTPEEDWRIARILNDQRAACDVLNDIITLLDFCNLPPILSNGELTGALYMVEARQTSAGKDKIIFSLKSGNDIVDIEYWKDDEEIEKLAEIVFRESLKVTVEVYASSYVKKREMGSQEYLKLVSDIRKRYKSGEVVSLQWKKFFEWEYAHAQAKIFELNTFLRMGILYEFAGNKLIKNELNEEMQKIHAWLTLHEVKYSQYGDTELGIYQWRLDEDA